MGMNYLPPLDDTDPGFFVFGAGTFGTGYVDMLEVSDAEWNKTFSDEAEYIDYVETIFKPELGASIVVQLTKSSVRGYFAYINTHGNPTTINHDYIDNLGRFRFTFYYMDEGVEPSGGAKVTTETISGPLSTIFSDNGWDEVKFNQLKDDISAGRASARIHLALTTSYFDAQLMVAGDGRSTLLCTAIFAPTLNGVTLKILWSYEGPELGIEAIKMAYTNGAWTAINEDAITQMTGQSSYDLIITRIEEE